YDKISRAPALTGDAPPPLPDDAEVQRKTFEDLHPVTQEAIRKALLEDRRLRGDDES
ncbi:MAG: hypothetical protein JWO64_1496, partial [Hyphomicrobiales bacterium]|nr:hypothetical protein [Hyphomicrobiales bacterium]